MSATATLAVLRAEPHLSVSAISAYLRCPAQFSHRYIWRTPPAHRPGVLAFGSAVHQALALFYTSLLDGTELEVGKLQQAFLDAWQEELGRTPPVLADREESLDAARDRGVALLGAFHEQAPRPDRVVGVEEAFSVSLPELGNVRLVGVFDAIVQDADGAFRILEHKTAARRWSEQRLATDLQLTAYALAAPLVGLGSATVTLQVLLKTKTPSLEVYRPPRTERDHRDFVDVAFGVHRAVEAGAFYPKPDWHCTGCPFAGPCRAS